jgi:hypothetical protein
MRHRIWFGFALGALALAVSVGSSSAGRTVAKVHGNVVSLALYAHNAGKLEGHSAAVNPKAGQIPVVGVSGKLAKSILPAGSVGPAGPPGPAGPAGPAGQDLTSQTPLQSGQSESGVYAASGFSGGSGSSGTDALWIAITFIQPVSESAPLTVVWNPSGTLKPHCHGAGEADPGYLCLYDDADTSTVSPPVDGYTSRVHSTIVGEMVSLLISTQGPPAFVSGEYTVTAA